MNHSPFKFLDSYTKEDKDIFFGRELEIEDLYTKVFQSKILLVYGASGTGKSSLISCGLANKFQDADWLPINVRRGLNINDSLVQQLEKSMLTLASFSGDVKLIKILKSIYLDHFKPIFLVFDQFEELFIFGDREEWTQFIEGVQQVINSELLVRFVFVIRGEYLEYLTEFEHILPQIFTNRIRVEKMTRIKAVNCIAGPCAASNIVVENGFPENLLMKLSPNKTEIELTYLQVFLDRIYKKAKEKSGDQNVSFSNQLLDELGNVGDVLSQFLDEQIELVSDGENALALLKAFVSTDATKNQISAHQASEFVKTIGKDIDEKKSETIIQELVTRRILKDQDESGRYELRHDSLASKIFEKITIYERDLIEVNQFITYAFSEHNKRDFLLNESDLAYIAPYENKLHFPALVKEFIEKSKAAVRKKNRSRKQFYIVMGIISLLLFTTVLGLVYSQIKKREADSNAILAQEQSNEALKQKEMADQQRLIAEQKQAEANEQAKIAREQSAIALAQSQEAERQRLIANDLRLRAESGQQTALVEKEKADVAKLEAEKYSRLADQNSKIAIEEKDRAAQYRMLAIAQAMGSKAAQLQDPEQKMLVAHQAFLFNQQYQGYPFQADIYEGLYSASKVLNGDRFNAAFVHEGAIKGLVPLEAHTFVTAGSDGKIIKASIITNPATISLTDTEPRIFQSITVNKSKKLLAVGSDEGSLLIYRLPGLEKIKEIIAHSSQVWAVTFDSQDNVYSGGADKKIIKWNISSNEVVESFKAESLINSLSFNSNLNIFAAGLAKGGVVLLKVEGDELTKIKTIPINQRVTDVKFNSTGALLAIGVEDGSILLWDMNKAEVTQSLTGHRAMISDLHFRDDDLFLVSASYDGTSMVWNMKSINERQVILADHGSWVLQACFDSDGATVVTADARGSLRYFPLNMEVYSARLCEKLTRNMTEKEWTNFVGEGIQYRKTCP